jgi:hypothetical protein
MAISCKVGKGARAVPTFTTSLDKVGTLSLCPPYAAVD